MKRFLFFLMVFQTVVFQFSAKAQEAQPFYLKDDFAKQEEILSFWFGELQNSYEWDSKKAERWFNGNEEFDKEICEAFGSDILLAASGAYNTWEKSSRGRLALIILLDQFSRNVFRGTPEAFQFQFLAEKLTLEGIEMGLDQELYPIERHFFYLPLMHSENINQQKRSLEVFYRLTEEGDARNRDYFLLVESYARNHFDIVKRFGRFPHRNAILGRASTKEEIEYLERAASYGQNPASTQ